VSPPIGSPAWFDELHVLEIGRGDVDALLAVADLSSWDAAESSLGAPPSRGEDEPRWRPHVVAAAARLLALQRWPEATKPTSAHCIGMLHYECERSNPVARWDEELALVGLTREQVDAVMEDSLSAVPSDASRYAGYDFGTFAKHGWGRLNDVLVRMHRFMDFDDEDSPMIRGLEGAVRFLAHTRRGFELDWVRTKVWGYRDHPADPFVRRWCARQAASLFLEGDDEDRAKVGVLEWEFLEFTAVGTLLVPWLVEDVPPELHLALLKRLGSTPWAGKRALYASFADHPEHHAVLAEALLASNASGVFHTIDAGKALALLGSLHAADADLRVRVERAITSPILVAIAGVAEPVDPEFIAQHPGCYLAALAFQSELSMWLMEAGLFDGDVRLGKIANYAHGPFPEGPTVERASGRSTPVGTREDASSTPESIREIHWHCIEGSFAEGRARLGKCLEFRPRLGPPKAP